MDEIVAMLLEGPESQVSPEAKDLIRKWSSPPKFEEVHDTVSQCCHASLASDFVMMMLLDLEKTLEK